MNLAEEITAWIKQQVVAAHKKGIVVGLSGGIDSAVTAVLAKKALQDNVIGLVLPCGNDIQDEELAIKVAAKFMITINKVDLYGVYARLCESLTGSTPAAKTNIKSRLRMLTLYYFANTLDYLVAGTSNKSDFMIGYFTKHGDSGCDILPLGGLLKTEVRKLAQDLQIPQEIVKRSSSNGLWEDQADENRIGISYNELDSCLLALEEGQKPDNNNLAKIKLMVINSEHKRSKIPNFKKN